MTARDETTDAVADLPGGQTTNTRDDATTLESYAAITGAHGWTEADIYRAIVCNLPRRLHALDAQTRRSVLRKGPPLTGTRWDALLAATAEHVARRHGHPTEPWMDERERFLDVPWIASARLPHMRWEALCYAPAAFIRHGTPIHPSDLDPRGGDEAWNGPP